MPKQFPKRVSREQHLKLIVVLILVLVVLIGLSWWGLRQSGGVAGGAMQKAMQKAMQAATPSATPQRSTTSRPPSRPPSATPSTTKFPTTTKSPSPALRALLELPRCDDTTFILTNESGRYTMLYDTSYRQAAWVAYLLTRQEVRSKGSGRSNHFRSDPAVIRHRWPTSTDADYTHSGYDRGHLLPSADRDDTANENESTFLLSNVSPQRAALNRQTWKALEEQVRRWAVRYDSLYVVTGPELRPGLGRLKGRVGVPERFFKAILVRDGDHYQAIAYLIPNFDSVQGTFPDYAMTVDELETELGYDLFHNLPEKQERRAESLLDRTFW